MFVSTQVRESFARLTQMATILNMETPGEVIDFYVWRQSNSFMRLLQTCVELFCFSTQGDLSGSKLTEFEIKKVLKLRSDFKVETINTLPALQSR